MAEPRFSKYWTHGLAAVVEFPGRISEIRHNLQGIEVRQQANTDNWLHLALPSPSIIDDQRAFIIETHLRGATNENARVDLIRIVSDQRIAFEQAVSFTDQAFNEKFIPPSPPVTRPRVRGGLTFTIHVSFLTGPPIGAVVLQSAGVLISLGSRINPLKGEE